MITFLSIFGGVAILVQVILVQVYFGPSTCGPSTCGPRRHWSKEDIGPRKTGPRRHWSKEDIGPRETLVQGDMLIDFCPRRLTPIIQTCNQTWFVTMSVVQLRSRLGVTIDDV